MYIVVEILRLSLSAQNERQAEFLGVREKVMRLWEELEMEPHSEFEQQVATGDIRNFVLSQENLTRLQKFYTEVITGFSPASELHVLPPPLTDCAAGGRSQPPGG